MIIICIHLSFKLTSLNAKMCRYFFSVCLCKLFTAYKFEI